MASGLDALRKSIAKLVAERLGPTWKYPYGGLMQVASNSAEANTMPGGSLVQLAGTSSPADPTNWHPLQVEDTGSADLGKFYLVPDIDYPGDPTKVVR